MELSTAIVKKAVEWLHSGGLIIYPTETAYALGCDATNQSAVDELFAFKKRPRVMSLPIIVSDIEMALQYARLSENAMQIAKTYWPGPLTLVTDAIDSLLPSGVRAHNGSVALRVSSCTIAKHLAMHLGRPIVATSANESGRITCYSIDEIKEYVDLTNVFVMDVGKLPYTKTSTILDVRTMPYTIIRQGNIFLSL